jgi:hypothetical protein
MVEPTSGLEPETARLQGRLTRDDHYQALSLRTVSAGKSAYQLMPKTSNPQM